MRNSERNRGRTGSVGLALGLALLALAAAGCAGRGGEATLKIGTLMPATGTLAAYGPDGQNAVDLAIETVNAADPAVKLELVNHEDDQSNNAAAAGAAMERLINRGAEVIIGSYSSGLTGSILDKAVESKTVVITPASTALGLSTERDNKGYFYRIPPADDLQATIMARLLKSENMTRVNIIAVNNLYGVGFGNFFKTLFEAQGGQVPQYVKYAPEATTFSSEVQQAGTGNPEAILLISYVDDGAAIMKEAYAKGLTGKHRFYFSEGPYSASFPQKAGTNQTGQSILAGFKGTSPELGVPTFDAAFQQRYGHKPALFAAQAYDGVLYAALAANYAGKGTAEAVKENFRTVANGPGEAATDVGRALELVKDQQDVDFQGVSHSFDFNELGDPEDGSYEIWRVKSDGTLETVQSGLRP